MSRLDSEDLEAIRENQNRKRPIVPNIVIFMLKDSEQKLGKELISKLCPDTEPSIAGGIRFYKSDAANLIVPELPGAELDFSSKILEVQYRIKELGEEFVKFMPLDSSWLIASIKENFPDTKFRDDMLFLINEDSNLSEHETNGLKAEVTSCFEKEKKDNLLFFSSLSNSFINRLLTRTEGVISGRFAKGGCSEEEVEVWREKWSEFYKRFPVPKDAVDSEADSFIYWAAGRAAVIAAAPIPLADVGPLVANEIYMITRLASLYGISVNNAVITMILGCCGASFLGKLGASFLPILKIPIAASITYGVGQAAKAYFASGMKLSEQEMRSISEREQKKYKENSDTK